jgi:hypothetical protein
LSLTIFLILGKILGFDFPNASEGVRWGPTALKMIQSLGKTWMGGKEKGFQGKRKSHLSLGWNVAGRQGSRIQISARLPRFPVMGTLF